MIDVSSNAQAGMMSQGGISQSFTGSKIGKAGGGADHSATKIVFVVLVVVAALGLPFMVKGKKRRK